MIVDIIAHNLAPIMFVTVMGMILIGYPVAFTLAAGGLIFFGIGVEFSQYAPQDISLFWNLLKAHPERFYGVMKNQTLLAIPFFTFMGIILERSGMAEDLLDTIGQLFGPVRGGVAFAVIVVGALLGATTGVVAASVMAMGLISLPIMMRYGYSRSFATGTIAASGSLAQIVPPSLVLIVMADQLGKSVGDMYVGALYPAGIMIGLYLLYALGVAIFRPKMAPALPKEARTLGGGVRSLFVMLLLSVVVYFAMSMTVFSGYGHEVKVVWSATTATVFALAVSLINRRFKLGLLSRLAEQVIIVLIPPLALIFLVLGTIFLGIATPTEGGAMGATGALVMAFFKRRISFGSLYDAMLSTTRLSAFVMFILLGARVFGLTFYGLNGNVWIEDLLLGLPGAEYGFLLTVTLIVFFLGMFLDFFEIAFILVPLLAPVADKLGIDLIWFGIILGINLQASFLTPPFGFALFYLRSIAPKREWLDKVTGKMMPPVKTLEIYKGAVPYIVIQMAMVLVVIAFPGLVTHYKADNAPKVQNTQIELPAIGGEQFGQPPGSTSNGGLPTLGLPPLTFGGDANAPGGGNSGDGGLPALGLPPLTFGGDAGPPTDGTPGGDAATNAGGSDAAVDLSQPPSFN